jgi:tricarballylate dehydrogenase
MYGRQSFAMDGVRRFWGGLVVEAVGGGEGLSDSLFAAAERDGAEVWYESGATELLVGENGDVRGVRVEREGSIDDVSSDAVVLACGGFEASEEMRVRHLGLEWAKAKVRGTEFNTGAGIQMALDAGAARQGDWGGCHAVAWDLNAPPFGNRRIADLYQKHSYPLGITVNVDGQRFIDEGADFRNYTYAKYGREILDQPQGVAFQLFDAKVETLLRDEYRITQVTKATSSSLDELADTLGIDGDGLAKTVRNFNASVRADEFDPTRLDGKCTDGIDPPKSNWAQPLDTPPYVGYAVTCGITFTYGGLRINASAQVLAEDGGPIPGLYAAGELVGGLYYGNYAGGTGLMAGAVFGRIAGAAASSP